MGTMMVSASPSSEGTESFTNDAITPQGRLYVPAAYAQTSGDLAVPLTSADHKVALRFTPEVDFALDAISFYVTAIGTTGDVSIELYDDGTAIEPNGELNGSYTNVAPAMTSNSTPSPYVVGLWDSTGANAETSGYEAYLGMNGSNASGAGVRSTAAPTSAAPIYYTVDFGSGNALVINRFRFCPFMNSDSDVRAFPKAWTFWGSNAESPTVDTDDDWTEIVGASAWTAVTDFANNSLNAFSDYPVTNGTAYRHYRWKITDRNGSSDYVSLGAIQVFEAQMASAPGALLQPFGTTAVGSVADTWIRHTFDSCQLQRQVPYWIVFAGEASKDFSLSVKRNSATAGSMFPDGCETRHAPDGSVWTQSQQDARQAMLNVILNSTTNHSSQLMYGRWNGRHVPLYIGSAWSLAVIPEAGIKLDCEALSVTTMYHVYGYDSAGTLVLEGSTSDRSVQDGVEVKSGEVSHRFLGVMGVDSWQSGYQGPKDTPDARLVRNLYNPLLKELSKDPNYASYTRADHYGDAFVRLNNNDDFMMRFVSWKDDTIVFTCLFFTNSAYGWVWGIASDGVCPHMKNVFSPVVGGAVGGLVAPAFALQVRQGFHSVWPVVTSSANQTKQFYLTSNSSPYRRSVCLTAALSC